MKCPPMLISLKFHSTDDEHDGGWGLWIPLFILAPIALVLLLALFLIALPFLLISVLFTWQVGWWRWLVFAVPAFFKTMHELPGLKVDVEAGKQKIYIAVY